MLREEVNVGNLEYAMYTIRPKLITMWKYHRTRWVVSIDPFSMPPKRPAKNQPIKLHTS